MPTPINEKLNLAHDFVLHTNRNIFLTGKAGTGKTTFLHQVKQLSAKRLVVVAPTGVAAINAGGVTIHSLFQLPFGPLVPGTVQREERKFNRDKIKLLRTLDLLIIDEISMVRADVLDGIDDVLRRYRNNGQPFGGVQLLLIGDMQQLPPVIRDEDWRLLSPYYDTGYFFGSKALRQTPYVSIELTHIYRQSDALFISLLNSIREKTVTPAQLADLNQRYIPNFDPSDKEGYITLSTHNTNAQQINSQKLKALPGKLQTFTATIEKDFPANIYPTEAELELKVGAQVMFIKNDISREKLYYNGKIGRVTAIDDGVVYVEGQQDGETIPVEPVSWENIRYSLDPVSKEIKAEVIGTFTQYPLKLAWAITIHKSQGLTFDKAIIDASAAFAHGQVYVALSRCKTLDGLVLRTPIPSHSIKTEQTLEDFHEQVQQQTPTEQHLIDAKRTNQAMLIQELFSFEQAHSLMYRCRRIANEHAGSLPQELPATLSQLADNLIDKARDISRRFVQQLPAYFTNAQLPENNPALQERIRKAASYFQTYLTDELLNPLANCSIECDNKQVREAILEAMDELEKELFSKLRSFESVREGFVALTYLQARNRAELDFQPGRKKVSTDDRSDTKGSLYNALMKWRNDLAGENNTLGYRVLTQKTIIELARLRPTSASELLKIKGFGKTKVKQIGADVLRIIQDYNTTTRPGPSAKTPPGHSVTPTEEPVRKPEKVDSAAVTLALFQQGKPLADIARERGFALSTVEGHLARCILSGSLPLEAVLPADKIRAIRTYLDTHRPTGAGEVVANLGGSITYADVRYVTSAIQAEQTI